MDMATNRKNPRILGKNRTKMKNTGTAQVPETYIPVQESPWIEGAPPETNDFFLVVLKVEQTEIFNYQREPLVARYFKDDYIMVYPGHITIYNRKILKWMPIPTDTGSCRLCGQSNVPMMTIQPICKNCY